MTVVTKFPATMKCGTHPSLGSLKFSRGLLASPPLLPARSPGPGAPPSSRRAVRLDRSHVAAVAGRAGTQSVSPGLAAVLSGLPPEHGPRPALDGTTAHEGGKRAARPRTLYPPSCAVCDANRVRPLAHKIRGKTFVNYPARVIFPLLFALRFHFVPGAIKSFIDAVIKRLFDCFIGLSFCRRVCAGAAHGPN